MAKLWQSFRMSLTFIGLNMTILSLLTLDLVPNWWRCCSPKRPFSPPNINWCSYWPPFSCSTCFWMSSFVSHSNKKLNFARVALVWEILCWWNLRLWLHPFFCSVFVQVSHGKKGRKLSLDSADFMAQISGQNCWRWNFFFDRAARKEKSGSFYHLNMWAKTLFLFVIVYVFRLSLTSPGYKHVLWKDVDIKNPICPSNTAEKSP